MYNTIKMDFLYTLRKGDETTKKVLIITTLLVIIVGSIFGYISYKKYSTKTAVQDYSIHDVNVDKENIEEIEPFIGNLEGDKNWLVYVKLKGDRKKYYYYKDSKRNSIVLESYILDGKEYVK